MFRNGEVSVGLTSLSRQPMMADNENMTKGKRKRNSGGAVARKTKALVWQCSECDAIMPLNDMDKPPRRCSNRKTCGKMFVNGRD